MILAFECVFMLDLGLCFIEGVEEEEEEEWSSGGFVPKEEMPLCVVKDWFFEMEEAEEDEEGDFINVLSCSWRE
jgi:hypothetical protein